MIANLFPYLGRNRDLFGLGGSKSWEDIQSDAYLSGDANTSNVRHFFDKLFRIHSMMLTDEGKRLAKFRHDSMTQFMQSLSEELILSGSSDGYTIQKYLTNIK